MYLYPSIVWCENVVKYRLQWLSSVVFVHHQCANDRMRDAKPFSRLFCCLFVCGCVCVCFFFHAFAFYHCKWLTIWSIRKNITTYGMMMFDFHLLCAHVYSVIKIRSLTSFFIPCSCRAHHCFHHLFFIVQSCPKFMACIRYSTHIFVSRYLVGSGGHFQHFTK